MALMNVTGHIQTGVIGILLIGSVIAPRIRPGALFGRRRQGAEEGAGP
jgi:hypothetical protein